jgi:hypothetical protein
MTLEHQIGLFFIGGFLLVCIDSRWKGFNKDLRDYFKELNSNMEKHALNNEKCLKRIQEQLTGLSDYSHRTSRSCDDLGKLVRSIESDIRSSQWELPNNDKPQ